MTIGRKPALWFVIAIFLLLFLFFAAWSEDDTYISFRYAYNLAHGHGLTFNPGERVEGYSNFLWTILLAGLNRAGLPIPFAAKTLSLVSGIATLFALSSLSTIASGEGRRCLFAPFLLSVALPFVIWTASALETVFYTFLVTAAVLRYYVERRDDRLPVSGILLALVSMTRPEGSLFFVALAVCHFGAIIRWRKSITRMDCVWVALFVLFVVPYHVWRIGYYGHLFPATYYAKVSGLGVAKARQVKSGIAYTYCFLRDFGGMWLALTMLVPVLVGRAQPLCRTCLVCIGANIFL